MKDADVKVRIAPNYFQQMATARRMHQEMHEKLLAAGARWDGMDGYDMTAQPRAK